MVTVYEFLKEIFMHRVKILKPLNPPFIMLVILVAYPLEYIKIGRNNPRTNVQKIFLFVIRERELEVEEDE